MEYRTDLALEYTEPASQRVEKKKNCTITRIRENGAEYITLEVPAISDHIDSGDELLHQLRDELRALLPEKGLVLVAGLGNRAITPDALGPQTAEQVLATRHIRGEIARVTGLDGLRPVAVVSTGVLGCTGVETRELLSALAREFQPAAVIAVDALAARSLGRLGCTIQLSTSGISPGSGVNTPVPSSAGKRSASQSLELAFLLWWTPAHLPLICLDTPLLKIRLLRAVQIWWLLRARSICSLPALHAWSPWPSIPP